MGTEADHALFLVGSNFVYMLVKKCEENPEYEGFIKVRHRWTQGMPVSWRTLLTSPHFNLPMIMAL
jgi:hypothetical protein